MTALQSGHTPVLLSEVLDVLQPSDGGIYIDGTFGAGSRRRSARWSGATNTASLSCKGASAKWIACCTSAGSTPPTA